MAGPDRKGCGNAYRTVVIQMQNEDRTSAVKKRKLLMARIIKHSIGPLNAKATESFPLLLQRIFA